MPEADLPLHLPVVAFSIWRGCAVLILISNVEHPTRPTARERGGLRFGPDCGAVRDR